MRDCLRPDADERELGGDDDANGRFINVRLLYPCRYNHHDDKPIFKRQGAGKRLGLDGPENPRDSPLALESPRRRLLVQVQGRA